uniref:Guanylate kinase-like domain-containing protein n=1 Tax=Strigamia maritima TaxID=126957 RepID=T1J4E0_STRMM
MAEDVSTYDSKFRRKSMYYPVKELTRKTIEDRLDFLSLSVSNKLGLKLTNIDALAGYVHLQVLKLAHNSLTSLSVLSSLTNLIYLDVPHNRNHKLFDFSPPNNLREANYNHNVLAAIPVLTSYFTLTKLQLECAYFHSIQNTQQLCTRTFYGLLYCKQLTYLSLTGNNIRIIDNLQNLPLRVLLLAANDIQAISNLETLVHLEVLDLSRNAIKKLSGLQGHYYLTSLDMSENQIKSISEFQVLGKLPTLRSLSMQENPVCENTLYRNLIMATQPSLLLLDGRRLSVSEKRYTGYPNLISPAKVKAITYILPQRDIVSVRDRFVNSVYTFLQPLKIRPSTSGDRLLQYPFLILLGPLGSFKVPLINRLIEEFPGFWKKAKSYTTRSVRPNEAKGYHFTTLRQFEQLQQSVSQRTGELIQTAQLYGQHYGLSWESIDQIAKDGYYPIAAMELEAILSLQLTHFRLYLIVAIPHDINIHRTRLETVLGLNEEIVQETLERRNLYFDYYNVDSGLFDMYINTDDPEAAYNQLKILVTEVKNRIIREKKDTMNSIFQWRPSTKIDFNNDLEVASIDFRRERARSAFIHNRAGKLYPMTSQFVVPLEINDDEYQSFSPKSEISV